jgi:hypothetical protein
MPKLQAQDREFKICEDFSGHLLHGLSRNTNGTAKKEIESFRSGQGKGKRTCVAYDQREVVACSATKRDSKRSIFQRAG